MTFEDRFQAVLLRYIQREVDQLATEIVEWYDNPRQGGCATCQYINLYFSVSYKKQDRRKGDYLMYWEYNGGLGLLIRELTDEDAEETQG